MIILRNIALLFAALFLTACAYGTEDKFASDTHVAQYRYQSNEAPSLSLITMVNNKNGRGGHSSLLINGSERGMYDPAGRWWHSSAPERHDFVTGMSPRILQHYKSWHARKTHHVVTQTIQVSPEVAELALAAARRQGRALDATCSINTIEILNQLPGFEDLQSTYFPEKLMQRFGQIPGVKTEKLYEED